MGIRGRATAVIATASISVFTCAYSAQCAETHAVNSDAIIKAITSANIVAPGYKLNAAMFPNTHEVVVSTYTNAASKDVVTDCKIDALLIAKKVTETAPQTVRVKVRFYDLNQASYREVVVTKPEISAFAAGAVKKDELLSSLEVVTVENAGQAANQTDQTAGESASQTQPTQPTTRAGAILRATDKFSVMRKNGLMFYYPKSWGVKDMSNQWGDFVELKNDKACWQSIICRLQDKDSPEQMASEDYKYYWSTHHHDKVREPSTVLIGYSKNIQAQIHYLKDNSNPADLTRYEKYVYFGYKHRTYSMVVRFCKNDLDAINADLNVILNTIVRE